MRSNIKNLLAFAFVSLMTSQQVLAQQCSDGVDNDGDGKTDALVTLSSSNGATYTYGGNGTSAEAFRAQVASQIAARGINISAPAFQIVRSDGGWDDSLGLHTPTLNAVCRIFGYTTAISSTCRDEERSGKYPNGKCNFNTPENNQMSRFNGSSFGSESATPKNSKTWITGITCRDRLASCSDGIDNDRDGLRDFPADPGCASAQDDSEAPHDLGCSSPADNTEAEGCRDGIDNDNDGLVDLADPGCSSNDDDDESNATSQCQDGIDNDNDGIFDATDPGCWSDPSNPATYDRRRNSEGVATSACQDGADNDADGLTDIDDPGCWSNPKDRSTYDRRRSNEGAATSACQDGVDNDSDGVADASDPGCWTDRSNAATYDRRRNDEGAATTGCQDQLDNDGDGVSDAQDPGCWTDPRNSASYDRRRTNEAAATTQCQDGSDNDADGVADAKDPGCWRDRTLASSYDKLLNSEAAATTQCQDNLDNDSDKAFDAADPGCWSDPKNSSTFDRTRNNEGAATTGCQDRSDNDGDGLIDANDPDCWRDRNNSATYDQTRSESGLGTSQCQDNMDNDNDGVLDASDPGCWSDPKNPATYDRTRNNEGAATTACQDGIDNDADGVSDALDPGCWTAPKNANTYSKTRSDEGAATTECQDKGDNDGDGVSDASDPGCWTDPKNSTTYLKTRNNEAAATTACQDKVDNDGDTLVDATDPGCFADKANPASYDKTRNDEGGAANACQDGIDNDKDGLVDLADSGCASPIDTDETDEVSKLQLITECVIDNRDGTFTAYFGYENLLGVKATVESNTAAKTVNDFSPAPLARGQVTSFNTGRVRGAFGVAFNGDPITWTVQIVGGAKSSATASRTTLACKPLEPVAECIDGATDGFKGTFGYINQNDFEVKVALGAANQFSPTPGDRGQPTSFFPGTNKGSFSANFKDQLQWTLLGKVAQVTPDTPVCPGGCIGTTTTDVKGNLDVTALKLADIAKQAAKFLTQQAATTGAKKARLKADAVRSNRKAEALAKRANELIIQFPTVVKSCPNQAAQCQTIDRGPVIEELKAIYAQLRNQTKRAIARATFGVTGKTTRATRLVIEAKTTEASGLVELGKLPRFATECGK